MSYWASIFGLSVLLLVWIKTFVDILRGNGWPDDWSLTSETPPAPIESPPFLSILVPARNEAHNIEHCVRSVMALDWSGPLELIIVDDGSTDATGDILDRLDSEFERLRVLKGQPLPPDWLGKPHALHVAQQEARGDWLWFIDADVQVEPNAAKLLVGQTMKENASMSSALGRLVVKTFWERVIQTRLGALIAGANPLQEVNDAEHERALANGQCILIRRDAYDHLGGHKAIRQSVLDDVDFAKRAKAHGVPYRLFFGPGVFRCRMYTGFSDIWSGWSKNLFPALEYSLIATLIITTLIFCSSVLPFVLLTKNLLNLGFGQPYEVAFIGMEACICALICLTDGIGHYREGYRWTYFWSLPIAMLIVIALFWNSAWRIKSGKGTQWKGRIVETQSAQHDLVSPTHSQDDVAG